MNEETPGDKIERLEEALEAAVNNLRFWYGHTFLSLEGFDQDRHEEIEPIIWGYYYRQAPEMRRIRESLPAGSAHSPSKREGTPNES